MIIGDRGGIGNALVDVYLQAGWQVLAVSSILPSRLVSTSASDKRISFFCGNTEESIDQLIPKLAPIAERMTRVIITTGILHDDSSHARLPEKRLADFNSDGFMQTIRVNSLLPMLWLAKLEPFEANVPADKLFTPSFVASRLMHIMASLPADGELSFLDWEGKKVEW